MIKNNFIAHGSDIFPKLLNALTQPGSEMTARRPHYSNSRTPLRMVVMPYEGAFCMLGKQGDRQSAVFTFCGF